MGLDVWREAIAIRNIERRKKESSLLQSFSFLLLVGREPIVAFLLLVAMPFVTSSVFVTICFVISDHSRIKGCHCICLCHWVSHLAHIVAGPSFEAESFSDHSRIWRMISWNWFVRNLTLSGVTCMCCSNVGKQSEGLIATSWILVYIIVASCY